MSKKALHLSLLCVFLFSLLFTFSYAVKIASVDGEFASEGVDISIETITEKKQLAPNMTVEYKPIIHYQGVDAYVRLALEVSDENIDLSNFQGLSRDWVKRGEYFYYTKPVHHGEDLATFTSFHVPESWTEQEPKDMMNHSFKVMVNCDALQAKNFSPDFESLTPWGDLEIEDSSYDGSDFTDIERSADSSMQIRFQQRGEYSLSSKKLLHESILPGDTYKGTISLFNDGKYPMEAFFSTKKIEKKEKINLLDGLSLRLQLDGKEIYTGTLRAAELNSWTSLLTLQPGTKHDLEYEVHMPVELQNEYEEKRDPFIWNFMVREKIIDAPKTGDKARLLFFLSLAGISLCMLLFMNRRGQRDEG